MERDDVLLLRARLPGALRGGSGALRRRRAVTRTRASALVGGLAKPFRLGAAPFPLEPSFDCRFARFRRDPAALDSECIPEGFRDPLHRELAISRLTAFV